MQFYTFHREHYIYIPACRFPNDRHFHEPSEAQRYDCSLHYSLLSIVHLLRGCRCGVCNGDGDSCLVSYMQKINLAEEVSYPHQSSYMQHIAIQNSCAHEFVIFCER